MRKECGFVAFRSATSEGVDSTLLTLDDGETKVKNVMFNYSYIFPDRVDAERFLSFPLPCFIVPNVSVDGGNGGSDLERRT